MTIKDQLKSEIDRLDERYLSLAYKVICQFPHESDKVRKETTGQKIASLLQEIANAGGLGIKDPEKWQKEIRKDRSLPFKEA